jgi:hypothetical protein
MKILSITLIQFYCTYLKQRHMVWVGQNIKETRNWVVSELEKKSKEQDGGTFAHNSTDYICESYIYTILSPLFQTFPTYFVSTFIVIFWLCNKGRYKISWKSLEERRENSINVTLTNIICWIVCKCATILFFRFLLKLTDNSVSRFLNILPYPYHVPLFQICTIKLNQSDW